jgi:preprotein translocase subunit SecF
MRSVNTSITSVLPVLSMLIVGSFFLGALTLQEFAIALVIGIIVGTYSSLFVASAVVAYMKEREAEHASVSRKVAARAGDDGESGTRSVTTEDVALGTVSQRPTRPTADQGPRPGGAPPRPRKKKKKR